jgi:hypothetical protein
VLHALSHRQELEIVGQRNVGVERLEAEAMEIFMNHRQRVLFEKFDAIEPIAQRHGEIRKRPGALLVAGDGRHQRVPRGRNHGRAAAVVEVFDLRVAVAAEPFRPTHAADQNPTRATSAERHGLIEVVTFPASDTRGRRAGAVLVQGAGHDFRGAGRLRFAADHDAVQIAANPADAQTIEGNANRDLSGVRMHGVRRGVELACETAFMFDARPA